MSHPETFIDSLEVKNYRCLPDGKIGPFGRFTVIAGRNGSGKSSLLEAIQICLSKSSYRVPEGNCSTGTARPPSRVSSLSLWRNGIMVSDFDENSGQKSKTQLLEELYGIQTQGQKARYLLPQLFSTHNLLTAERVVLFLEARESNELQSALEELLLGREVLDTWSYIERARLECARILQSLDAQSAKSRSTTSELQADIQKLSKHDSNVVARLVDDAKKHIHSALWGEPPADLISECGQLWAREVESKLSQLGQRIEQLQMASFGDVLPETWAQIPVVLQANKGSLDQLNQDISDVQSAADEVQLKQQKGKTEILKHSETVEKLQSDLQKRHTIRNSCREYVTWLPEIAASCASKALKHEVQLIEQTIATVRTLTKQASDLDKEPNPKQLHQEIAEAAEQEKTAREKLRATKELLSKAKSAYGMLQESLKTCETNNTAIDHSIGQLSAALETYLSLTPSTNCPACGKEWPDRAALKTAIAAHRQSLLSDSSPMAKEMVRLTQETERQLQELSRLTETHNAIRTQLNEITATLAQLKNKAATVKREYDLITQRVRDLKSIELDEPPQSPGQIVQLLNVKAFELASSSAEKTRTLDSLWAGLRREQFEAHVADIESLRDEISDSFSDIQLNAPEGHDSAPWNKLVEQLVQLETSTKMELSAATDALKIAKANDERLTLQLTQCRKDLDVKQAQLKKSLSSLVLLEKLKKLSDRLLGTGFVELQNTINFSTASERIDDVIRMMEKICAEIRAEAQRLEERNVLTVRLEKEQASLSTLECQLKRAHYLQNKLQSVRSIHDYEQDSWHTYEEKITAIFRRLHWPEDFKNIEFQKLGSANRELHVRRPASDKTVAASTQLSAGQRAALAVSTFWALNMSPKRIPPLIMMDEPIQNIDEMNTLNFLDGLRGLVEQGGRQILLTTANDRLRGLLRRKFSYLGPEYVEIDLSRDSAQACSVIARTDAEQPEYELRIVSA